MFPDAVAGGSGKDAVFLNAVPGSAAGKGAVSTEVVRGGAVSRGAAGKGAVPTDVVGDGVVPGGGKTRLSDGWVLPGSSAERVPDMTRLPTLFVSRSWPVT
jgi:hypothetical protein